MYEEFSAPMDELIERILEDAKEEGSQEEASLSLDK